MGTYTAQTLRRYSTRGDSLEHTAAGQTGPTATRGSEKAASGQVRFRVIAASDDLDPTRWSRQQLASVQDERLVATLRRCADRHPHYSDLWRRRGVDVASIRSTDELARLPLTTKSDFLAAPDSFRLRPRPGDLPEDLLWDVMYTTGSTTGQPSAVYATAADHHRHLAAARREGGFIGLGAEDTIANLLPLTPFPMGAYARSASDAAAVGAAMVWGHTGRGDPEVDVHRSLDEAVDLVLTHRATVLWGIASFVRRFLMRCADRGVELGSVRMCLVTGEAVTASVRSELARLMRHVGAAADQVVNRYGATELGTSLYECAPGSGLHLLTPEDIFLETVDAETGQPVDDGQVGALAFTHLQRSGTVLLRYLLGDLTSLSHEPCPHCGRTTPRLTTPPTRSAGLVKVKGTLVDLNALHERLRAIGGVQDVQIVLTRADQGDAFSPDVLEVRACVPAGAEGSLREAIVSHTARLAFLSPQVSFVPPGELFDPFAGPKTPFIVDKRHLGG